MIKLNTLSNNNKYKNNKSLNMTTFKTLNNSKIIRFSKDLKPTKKPSKKKKEGVSKYEIDLSKLIGQASSSRSKQHNQSKDYSSVREETKSVRRWGIWVIL